MSLSLREQLLTDREQEVLRLRDEESLSHRQVNAQPHELQRPKMDTEIDADWDSYFSKMLRQALDE